MTASPKLSAMPVWPILPGFAESKTIGGLSERQRAELIGLFSH